jgi:hypothetical protein
MSNKKDYTFPLTTNIELVAIRGKEIFKKVMTFEKSLKIPKKKGWTYIRYEIGFSQYNE